MKDYVKQINPNKIRLPRALKTAVNTFFNKHPYMLENCKIYSKDHERCNAIACLVFEGSPMYEELNYGYGEGSYLAAEYTGTKVKYWEIQNDFLVALRSAGYYYELLNCCVLGFYED